jgi:uncharacterized phage-like protein YoqJ
MIISFTGNRILTHPPKKIAKQLILFLTTLSPTKTISGMALGFDQLAARVCVYLGIPFIAAIPSKDQPKYWPKKLVKRYKTILKKADEIVYVDKLADYSRPSDTFKHKLFNRNYWMVDNSDKVISYNFRTEPSGTESTIRYAMHQQKMVIPMVIR